jgi:hypothetical protein
MQRRLRQHVDSLGWLVIVCGLLVVVLLRMR